MQWSRNIDLKHPVYPYGPAKMIMQLENQQFIGKPFTQTVKNPDLKERPKVFVSLDNLDVQVNKLTETVGVLLQRIECISSARDKIPTQQPGVPSCSVELCNLIDSIAYRLYNLDHAVSEATKALEI